MHRILCLICLVSAAAARANDCYLKETKSRLLIGNSKIEIALDARSGAITGLHNKPSRTSYLANGPAEVFRLFYSNEPDLWNAVTGTIVRGSRQRMASHRFEQTANGARLQVEYDKLQLERRSIAVVVRYTIELAAGDEEAKWKMFISNREKGTVREVEFPFVAGLAPMESVIMPNQGGERLHAPLSKLSDEHPVISVEYPSRASMQWFAYYGAKAGLYMASYDKKQEYTRLNFGRPGEGATAAMWITKNPFATAGKDWESPELALGIHAGDWHFGADRYRTWLQSWTRPVEPPKWIEEMTGGRRELTIKDRNETTRAKYEDILRIAKGMQDGSVERSILVVGWFYNGHDTYFPEFKAIPDLGGDEALRRAVRQANEMGVKVTAYMNARLANIETETYKKNGKRWAVLGKVPGLGVSGTDFFELHEEWNKTWERSRRSEGWFAVMCPSAKGWQDYYAGEAARVVRTYGFQGLFLDQPGSYYAELCWNRHHGHSTPATAWGPGLLELFRRIRVETKKSFPEFAMWTEGLNDVYAQYLDYHTDKNPVWEPMRIHPESETFVEMWRYALPHAITQNRVGAYSYPPSQDKIYGDAYHFVMGIRGIGGGASADPARAAAVAKLQRLWRTGAEFFFKGRFMDDVGLKMSNPGVFAKVYGSEQGVALPIWNTTGNALSCDLSIDLKALGRSGANMTGATSLEGDDRVPYKVTGDTVSTQVKLQPHDTVVLVLRVKR